MMEPDKIVRKACQAVYNLSYEDFMKLFNIGKSCYALEKFQRMNDDFGDWFCGLDSQNAKKFMDYVMQRED